MFDSIMAPVAVCTLILALLTGGLYLHTNSKLKALDGVYTQLKQDFKELDESKGKVIEGSKQDDSLATAQTLKIQSLEQEKQSLLDRLNKIPKDISPKPSPCKSTIVKGETVNEINIDAELPADVVSLLDSAYKNKGSTSTTPK